MKVIVCCVLQLLFESSNLRRRSPTVTMNVVMAILLLINVTRHHVISASPGDVIVARQHHQQPANGHLQQAAAAGKRWAPTEIRMNEFIHKIRSRINSHSAPGFARRAVRRTSTSDQSEAAARKILKNNRRAQKSNRGVKLYKLRTRWGRIPSAVNVGGEVHV